MQEATLIISILSLMVSIGAIIVSTLLSLKAYHYSEKEFKLNKRNELYNLVNPFLITLECEASIYDYDSLEKQKDEKELDYDCLDTISKINAFCQINSIDKGKATRFIEELGSLSNEVVKAQKNNADKEVYELLQNKIREQRYKLKIMIEDEDFIKLK